MVTWWTADEFLDIYDLPKFIYDWINNLSRPITSNKIEVISNPSAELKSIAEKLNSDDNPVLMVVKLK